MVKHHSAAGAMRKSLKAQKIRTICLIIIAGMGLSLQIAAAQPPASVVILPFEIFSEKDMSYLQTEIPAALKRPLEPIKQDAAELSAETIQERLREAGVSPLKKVPRTGRCQGAIAGSGFRAGLEKKNGKY